jgi:hypothetical protein
VCPQNSKRSGRGYLEIPDTDDELKFNNERQRGENQRVQRVEQEETVKHFLALAQKAADIALSTNTDENGDAFETTIDSLEREDVSWQAQFHPNGNFVGDIPPNPPLSDIDISPEYDGGSICINHLSSYEMLIDKLLGDEVQVSEAFKEADGLHLKHLCRNTLLPIDTRILHCLVRGDLPRMYRNDINIKRAMNVLWKSQSAPLGAASAEVQRCIYFQYLVDRNGLGFNAIQRATLYLALKNTIAEPTTKTHSVSIIGDAQRAIVSGSRPMVGANT